MIFVGTWCPSLAEPGEWMVGVMSQVPTPGTGHSSITWSELSRAEVLPLLTPDPWPRIGEKYLSVTQSGWVPSGGGQLDPVVLKLETHIITAKVRLLDLQICNLQNYFIQTNFVFETGDWLRDHDSVNVTRDLRGNWRIFLPREIHEISAAVWAGLRRRVLKYFLLLARGDIVTWYSPLNTGLSDLLSNSNSPILWKTTLSRNRLNQIHWDNGYSM